MITFTLPLLKLWFWLTFAGVVGSLFIAVLIYRRALTRARSVASQVDAWDKVRIKFDVSDKQPKPDLEF